jgi:hypothetical protein
MWPLLYRLQVEVSDREPVDLESQVPRDGQGLQEDRGPYCRRAEVQEDPSLQPAHRLRIGFEIPACGLTQDRKVAPRMLMNYVGADCHVDGEGHPQLVRVVEHAVFPELEAAVLGNHSPERVAAPQAIVDPLLDGQVHEQPGLLGHAERPVLDA